MPSASSTPSARTIPIRVIALYTEPERSAMFVRHADEAYSLGPTATVDADGKRTGAYLNYEGLKQALIATEADAVWPGWGFVAEHPAFADMIEEMGLVFVGPSGDVMRALGDKIQSKLMAEKAGVPVAPWTNGPVETIEEAREHARAHRLPADDQGGRGRRRARHPQGHRRRTARARADHARAARPRTRSATAPSSWRRWSATRTTSRCS